MTGWSPTLVVWIDGASGVGKTADADELVTLLPKAPAGARHSVRLDATLEGPARLARSIETLAVDAIGDRA